ncbi:hypothetical protein C6W27_09035 [Bacillus paralicheniformis]|uniref:hypothetical protein n=1 Tax=Bacillus paralicheniformis TaxID=1648923 RepID=UPI000D03B5B4|nr:hypothetical protein [Bacillus paralicheniformis]PRS16535.1 hypothetical protein C6W27_09035 [Bacillus paralicheniformis]
MPNWVQWISFGLSIIGSVFGVWAFILNYQRTAIIKRKEKERLDDKKKASFTIDRTQDIGRRNMLDKFVLHNNGQAEARNVQVEIYNYDRKGDGSKRKIQPLQEKVPTKINANQEVRILISIAGNTALPWEVVVTWDDDYQEGNKIEATLN